MDRITAEILCKLTDDFYTAQARSFSATRQSPWPGWSRILADIGLVPTLDAAEASLTAPLEEGLFRSFSIPFTALDIGAGNLRFFRYLRSQLPTEVQLDLYAVDNCEALLPDEEALANEFPYVRFQKLDVLQRLVHESSLSAQVEAPACSLVSCFGLMHHVPGGAYRARLLAELVEMAAPGGFVAVSFWQFMNNPELARKAAASHELACANVGLNPAVLDAGDWLLGWQELEPCVGQVRYCHSFTDEEIDALVASLPPQVEPRSRFRADGRTGELNTYLVLRRLS